MPNVCVLRISQKLPFSTYHLSIELPIRYQLETTEEMALDVYWVLTRLDMLVPRTLKKGTTPNMDVIANIFLIIIPVKSYSFVFKCYYCHILLRNKIAKIQGEFNKDGRCQWKRLIQQILDFYSCIMFNVVSIVQTFLKSRRTSSNIFIYCGGF